MYRVARWRRLRRGRPVAPRRDLKSVATLSVIGPWRPRARARELRLYVVDPGPWRPRRDVIRHQMLVCFFLSDTPFLSRSSQPSSLSTHAASTHFSRSNPSTSASAKPPSAAASRRPVAAAAQRERRASASQSEERARSSGRSHAPEERFDEASGKGFRIAPGTAAATRPARSTASSLPSLRPRRAETRLAAAAARQTRGAAAGRGRRRR